MELSVLISSFSHVLNIKGKLFSKETTVVSLEDKKEFNKKYCSIYTEHSFDPYHKGLNKKEKVELILAKRSEFTVPIRHIDWVILETKLDPFIPSSSKIPNMLLIKNKGKQFVTDNLENILKLHIDFLGIKGRKLKKALDSLSLQVTYADGHNVIIPAQESLKESLCIMHQKRLKHDSK